MKTSAILDILDILMICLNFIREKFELFIEKSGENW